MCCCLLVGEKWLAIIISDNCICKLINHSDKQQSCGFSPKFSRLATPLWVLSKPRLQFFSILIVHTRRTRSKIASLQAILQSLNIILSLSTHCLILFQMVGSLDVHKKMVVDV